jgi:hypothetical protein
MIVGSTRRRARGGAGRGTARALLGAAIACMVAARPVASQPPPRPTAVVSGVVYDSIVRHTIAGATVEIVSADDPAARPLTAVSDAAGRYTVPGVPFGSYLAGFFHPALDTLGLETAPRRVNVSASEQRVDLATPSARTVMATICPAGTASDSTGLMIGHVRSTEEQGPVAGASVVVEWSETIVDMLGLRERNLQVTGQSAEPGWFAICGLPADVVVQARASSGADSSGYVEVEVPANGLRHVSFFVGGASRITLPVEDTVAGRTAIPETALRGRARLTGTVVDYNGKPVINAHALVWGTKLDAATNERGAFSLDGLPGGTHTLEIRVIGYIPVTSVVQLAESRPATANIVLAKAAEILPTVTVRGEMVFSRNLAEFERRRRSGFGSYRTSADIARRGPNVKLSQLLQDVLGVRVDRRGGQSIVTMQRGATTGIGRASCVPSLYVDGMLDRLGDYDAYYAEEIAGLEVYARESTRPFEFIDPQNPCGVVAIWTRTVPKKPRKPSTD